MGIVVARRVEIVMFHADDDDDDDYDDDAFKFLYLYNDDDASNVGKLDVG